MHYYQFNIKDYASHTRHLSNDEDLIYRRLLDMYYLGEKPLTGNLQQLARLIDFRDSVADLENVLNDFFVLINGKWVNKRADEEIAVYHLKADTARDNGKKGGRPKKTQSVNDENPEITQSVILDNPEITGLKANQEPITNNQEPDIKKLNKKRFDEFWVLYPNKKSKAAALNAWMKINLDDDLFSAITESLQQHKQSRKWNDSGGKYIPHPATWLNGKRWEDELNTGDFIYAEDQRNNRQSNAERAKAVADEWARQQGLFDYEDAQSGDVYDLAAHE